MDDFWACTLAEVKALGLWCFIHGPEFWLGVTCISIGVIAGLLLAALLHANWRNGDE